MSSKPWRSSFQRAAAEVGNVASAMAAAVAGGEAWGSETVEAIAAGTAVERLADVSGVSVSQYARDVLRAAGHASPSSASASSTD